MGSGLFERWNPVTHDYGLIRAPIREVVREFVDWQGSINVEHSQSEITSGFAAALQALPPLSAAKHRRLFVATSSDWVACFQSGIDGSDPFTAMSFLAGRMGVLAMRVCSTRADVTWPATIWEVYAPESLGGQPPLLYRRSICAAKDGGHWVFEQSGEPYPFESLAAYEKPRKRDRFTRGLLQEYLANFGIRPFADDFFVVSDQVPAFVLQRSRRANDPPEFTLDEVVTGKPWKHQ
jgi:hypothetical protein